MIDIHSNIYQGNWTDGCMNGYGEMINMHGHKYTVQIITYSRENGLTTWRMGLEKKHIQMVQFSKASIFLGSNKAMLTLHFKIQTLSLVKWFKINLLMVSTPSNMAFMKVPSKTTGSMVRPSWSFKTISCCSMMLIDLKICN